jgi:hypothetical protein
VKSLDITDDLSNMSFEQLRDLLPNGKVSIHSINKCLFALYENGGFNIQREYVENGYPIWRIDSDTSAVKPITKPVVKPISKPVKTKPAAAIVPAVKVDESPVQTLTITSGTDFINGVSTANQLMSNLLFKTSSKSVKVFIDERCTKLLYGPNIIPFSETDKHPTTIKTNSISCMMASEITRSSVLDSVQTTYYVITHDFDVMSISNRIACMDNRKIYIVNSYANLDKLL